MQKILALTLLSLATTQAKLQLLDVFMPKHKGTFSEQVGSFLGNPQTLNPQPVQGFLACSGCQLTTSVVDSYLVEKKSIDFMEDIGVWVCANYVMKNDTVCEPMVTLMGDIVVHSLTEFILSPDFVCSNRALNMCDSPKYIPLEAEDYKQHQLAQKKPSLKENNFLDSLYDKVKADPNERDTITVVHMSDIHMDFKYVPGTITTCNLPLCCHEENGFTSDPSIAAGKWGDFHCDLPAISAYSMFDYIKDQVKPDMFVWTGDNSPHTTWKNTREEVINYVQNATDEFALRFDDNTAVYPIEGNHEAWPVNVDNFDKAGDNIPINHFAEIWKQYFTSEEALKSYKAWGYYSEPLKLSNGKVLKNSRVIAINSQAANSKNWHLFHSLTDPGKQIDWLEGELLELQKVGGSALIISHIPPNGFLHSFGERFRALTERFQDVIRFGMYGHTHKEQFHLVSAYDGKAIGFDFVAGSGTTNHYRHPSFHVATLDAEYLIPLNIETHFMNLTTSNAEDRAVWGKLHDWVNEYSMKDLRPTEVQKLTERIRDDEATASLYLTNQSRQGHITATCDEHCRKSTYCAVSASETDQGWRCKHDKAEDEHPKKKLIQWF